MITPLNKDIVKNNLQILHENDVKDLKWNSQYISFIHQDNYLDRVLAKQIKLPCIPFDNTGVIRQEMFDMILDVDYNNAKKQPHPKGLGQASKNNKIPSHNTNETDEQ